METPECESLADSLYDALGKFGAEDDDTVLELLAKVKIMQHRYTKLKAAVSAPPSMIRAVVKHLEN